MTDGFTIGLEWDATAPKDVVLPESGEPIEVHISIGRRDVYAGSEIYTALRSYPGDVTVKIVGIAASAQRDCNGRRYG